MIKISVLSGKGGAGKTFISTNLANVIKNSTYIDMDVEEPNGLNYFKIIEQKEYPVKIKIPKINYAKCNNCRACVDECVYGGLMFISKPIVLNNLCHSCTKCAYVCKNAAIEMIDKEVGIVTMAKSKDNYIISGKMNILESSGTPIIEAEKDFFGEINIIDSPPGSSCLTISSIIDSDYLVIVAEDSAFGLHNFKMVVELAKELKKPYGVVINKQRQDVSILYKYVTNNHLFLLDTFAFDKNIYQENGSALLISQDINYRDKFVGLAKKILEQVDENFSS